MTRPDLIVAATDPPLLGLLGAWLKRRWNCRLAYNVRDLYPDIAEINGGLRNRPLFNLLAYANRHAFAAADRIIVVGDDMRERIAAKGVAPGTRYGSPRLGRLRGDQATRRHNPLRDFVWRQIRRDVFR